MHPRAATLVNELNLLPHPEGGFYAETFRSTKKSADSNRVTLTSIYFLLTTETVSRFHRITSDECWYFHEGDSLVVHSLTEKGHEVVHLGLPSENTQPFYVVPSGTIFGSCLADNAPNGYALVSCAVAPGFDFADFELFETEVLFNEFPEHEAIVRKLS